MKIIEAMKELKLIESKLAKNAEQIKKYASRLSISMPDFRSDDEQRRAVKELLQSSEDLTARYMKLKKDIEYTNIVTTIDYNGKVYSLSDILVMKRKAIAYLVPSYKALDSSQNDTYVRTQMGKQTEPGKEVKVIKFYDETEKNKRIAELDDMEYSIDSRLEVINATMELREAPVE